MCKVILNSTLWTRMINLWRRDHYRLGYKASSPVESPLPAYQHALDGASRSFLGIVQVHVKKNKDKAKDECHLNVNL
ncbi:hypothetical protein ACHAW6_009893 [Cyclotella cf. meneghiniana]